MRGLSWLAVAILKFAGGRRGPIVVLTTVSIGCGLWGAFALAGWYWRKLDENAAWVETTPVERASRLVGALFERAVEAGLIVVEAGPDRIAIRPPPCTERFSPLPHESTARRQDLLDLLCTTLQGAEIAAEIRQWNASFHFLAVRDDRGRGTPCSDGTMPHPAWLVTGCKPSRWQARRLTPGGSFVVETPSGRAPPGRDFAMIAARLRRGANDWLMIASAAGTAPRPLRLTSRLDVAEPVIIDLIGRPLAISVDGEKRAIAFDRDSDEAEPIGPVSLTIDRLCAEGVDCTGPPRRGTPHAFALTLRSATPVTVDLALDAAPIRTVPEWLRDRKKGSFTLRRSAHIAVTCRPECTPAWAPIVTVEARRPGRHAILMRDGTTALVDESGRISAEALDLGLAAVVGLGPLDTGSLAATLAASGGREDRRVVLTLDPEIQAAAVEILGESVACPAEDADECRLNPERRAALVVMDASDRAGEILAMVSWPPLRAGLNIWDIKALEADGSNRSPVAGHAWRATDRYNVPGSTFKVVSALAAAEVALSGNAEVGDLLRGAYGLREAAGYLGLQHRPRQSDCSPVDLRNAAAGKPGRPAYDTRAVRNDDGSAVFCIQNPSNLPFSHAWLTPEQSGCRVRRGGRRQIGVCEALLTSSNLFFAGLALIVDGNKVVRGRGKKTVAVAGPLPKLAQAVMARRLFPDRAFDLLRGQGPQVGRLMADGMTIAAVAPGSPRRYRVALAGYGQAVRATPLAIASVFASVGGGRIVRPRLVRRRPGEDPAPAEGAPLLRGGSSADREALLSLIRDGLEATVASSSGTAHAVFASPKRSPFLDQDDRLFLKTGTADVTDADEPGPRLYASWVAGWIEGDREHGIRRRLAFACWRSHSRDSGAKACGPIVRRLLERLDTRGDP